MPTALATLLLDSGSLVLDIGVVVVLRWSWRALPIASGAVRDSFLTVLDWSPDATLTALDCRGPGGGSCSEGPTGEAGPMGRRPAEVANRAPVNLERTLQVALAVADDEGIEAVTMRRLARELGVEAASLYHHVNGKDQILDGLVDVVAAEIEPPTPSADWRDGHQPAGTQHARGPAPPPLGRELDGVKDEPGAGHSGAAGDRDPVLPRGRVLGPPGRPCDLGGRQLRARIRAARGQPALPRRVGAGSHDRGHHGDVSRPPSSHTSSR